MHQTFTIGFSPCPNDTFIFDPLVNGLIDTEGITFKPVLEDVQTLNQWAIDGRLDITKLSYGVLPKVLDQYTVLPSGGALGEGVGPLLIARDDYPLEEVEQSPVAIPGENTTAHFLFSLAFPAARNKQFMVFSGIEDAVLSGKVKSGVIIHENRFTYQLKGLKKQVDLGEYWEQKTGNPIPLGAIVMRRAFSPDLQQQVNRLIQKSLDYSWNNYPQLSQYVKDHSQEMEESVMRQHINLYVNDYTKNLGNKGRAAVMELLNIYKSLHPSAKWNAAEIFMVG